MTASLDGVSPQLATRNTAGRAFSRLGAWPLLFAAAGIPVSLLWDFSWESTVGIDRVWSAAHTATYLAVALAGVLALALVWITTRTTAGRESSVRLGRLHAPLGVWMTVWGAFAFAAAVLFDRWWQSAYGLGAGIWHPPQILKAVAFFGVITGVWLFCLSGQNSEGLMEGELMVDSAKRSAPINHQLANHQPRVGFAVAFAGGGGLVMALITVMTLISIYPNRQHSAWFYKVACSTYPIVLVALARAGRLRFPAVVASFVYTAIVCLMVWLLPLFPAKPQVPPIYNPLDHLMPPPFPLLLILPALGLDALFRNWPWPAHRFQEWSKAGLAGLAFFIIFIATQWVFAEFLLTHLSDNWFFAGGGGHWPFFLRIDPLARQVFWETRQDEMNFTNTVFAAGLAMLSARLGLWIGAWMKRLQR